MFSQARDQMFRMVRPVCILEKKQGRWGMVRNPKSDSLLVSLLALK